MRCKGVNYSSKTNARQKANQFLQACRYVFLFILIICSTTYAQALKYPLLSKSEVVLEGDSGKWDSSRVHTLSVVEANRAGYKYWGYYGLSYYALAGGLDTNLIRAGLARSNDLIHWDKYEENPIIESDCRWPTAVVVGPTTYLFYAQYDHITDDSRIVMVSSKDGIHFHHLTVVVPRERGMQNQNPFIYFNKKDRSYYLFYYSGIEKSKDTTSDNWNIMFKRAKNVEALKDVHPTILLSSDHTMAAPSIVSLKDRYYLLVEEWNPPQWGKNWVTSAYESNKIDGTYKIVENSPVLSDNDACGFEYVFHRQLYIFYSHQTDTARDYWNLKMVKATK